MSEESKLAEEVESVLGQLLAKHGFAVVSAVLGWSCDLIIRAGREPAPVMVAFVAEFADMVAKLGADDPMITADPVLSWARATSALRRLKA